LKEEGTILWVGETKYNPIRSHRRVLKEGWLVKSSENQHAGQKIREKVKDI